MEPSEFNGTSLGFSPLLPRHQDLFSFPFLFFIVSIISICGCCQGPMHLCLQTITHALGTKEPSPVPIASGTRPTVAAQTPPRCLRLPSHAVPCDPPGLWPSRARRSPASCTSPPAENTPNLPARCNADTPRQSQQLQGTTSCSSRCRRSGLARGRSQ